MSPPASTAPPVAVEIPSAGSALATDTTTFLFTDIEASTAEWETSADMPRRLDLHLTILREAVAAFGGTVFATMGDGIAAAFPSAGAAVRAAVAAQRALPESGLRARMGLHTGEAERVGGDHRGRPVNRAARIMSMGRGGQILLSDLCAALIRNSPDPVDLMDLGSHRLRGLRDLERIWQVVDPDLGEAAAPVRGVEAAALGLPRPRTPLLGRQGEVARVIDLARRAPIVTLTGTGGVGKTRLALHVAGELASSTAAAFVELANLPAGSPPVDVAHTIAAAVGVGGTGDPIAAAAAVLDHCDTVLVVDSCEHVIDGAAEVIAELTDRSGRLTIIATSREPLGIDGEHVMRVKPLSHTTAVALFRWRAEAAGMEPEAVDDDLALDIVRMLDRLPLAIELAAARAGTLGLAAIADGLRRRTPLPARRDRGRSDRQATMGATIAWSYDLLTSEQQRLLSRLAVFPNGADLDAVVHVSGQMGISASAATDDLASLVDKSMITAEPQAHGVRYRMLETMRSHLLAQLDVAGEREVAQLAMAEWVASITDLPFSESCGPASLAGAIRLEREVDGWRDAVLVAGRVGRAALAARLCGPPTAFFLLGRHDLADCVRSVVELCRDEPLHRRATLCALMVSAAGTSDAGQMQEWADEMAALDERALTGLGQLMQWLSHIWGNDFEGAVATCLAGAGDRRLPDMTRDLLLAIAVLDRFSLTGATTDRDHLIERALACAERSTVALTRVSSRLGAAWGLADSAPERSLELVRQAMADLDHVPAITRLTLPGSAFRLLAGLDARVAAKGLLDQLDAHPSRRSAVDLIPLSYAIALLDRVGHTTAADIEAAATVAPQAPHVSMMDFVAQARHMVARSSPQAVAEIEGRVRGALAEIADGTADGPRPALEPPPAHPPVRWR